MRMTLILSAVIAALCLTQASCLVAIGKRDATIRARDQTIATMTLERKRADDAAALLGVRDATVAGEAARACGLEGQDAFTRGVAVGRAVCAARGPQ